MTWADLAAIEWHQWVVIVFGTSGVVMTQIGGLERFACFPGLVGQIGWFAGLQPNQPGFLFVSVVCALAWLWGLYRHWAKPLWQLCSELDSATTYTDVGGTSPALQSRNRQKKPRLRLVSNTPKRQ